MSDNRWLTGYSAAVLGSILTSSSVGTWYAELRKFSFNPPNWIFAPVWSALYFLMALSAWLVWRKAGWSGAKICTGSILRPIGLECRLVRAGKVSVGSLQSWSFPVPAPANRAEGFRYSSGSWPSRKHRYAPVDFTEVQHPESRPMTNGKSKWTAVFVHGIFSSGDTFKAMADAFDKSSAFARCAPYHYNYHKSMTENAKRLAAEIKDVAAPVVLAPDNGGCRKTIGRLN